MHNYKILKIHISLLLLGIVSFKSTICMDVEKEFEKKRRPVYSHGFGESCDDICGPKYPDAPGKIFKGVFYTKPAVHALANHLKEKLNEGYIAIDLEAKSIGAGTAINCLDKLIHYDQNPGYFNGTNITSKADADAIIAAINNGSLDLTTPALSLKKVNMVAIPSKCLGYTSITAACYTAYRWGLFDTVLNMMGINPTITKNIAAALTTCAANYALGSTAKSVWATFIDTFIVPPVTGFNYNPFHTKPIDAVENLRGKIKCPTLIHYCKQDGVIENPDESTVEVYDALRTGNEGQTHIYLSEPGDGHHNWESAGHYRVQREFKHKYEIKSDPIFNQISFLTKTKTQPSLEELRKTIFNPASE